MVSVCGGVVLLQNFGMKYALTFAIPRNSLTSAVMVGLAVITKAVVWSWVGATPCAEKITPNNPILGMPRTHF